jgi:hypothetical protein
MRVFGGFITHSNNNPHNSTITNPDISGLLSATFRPVNLNNSATSSASGELNIITKVQIPGFTTAHKFYIKSRYYLSLREMAQRLS